MRATLMLLLLTTAATPATAKPAMVKPVTRMADTTMAASYTTAVTAPGRPASQVALDAGRKPVEILSFMGLMPGMKVLDVLTGAGYYAEIMGRVVGPNGSVTAFAPGGYNADKTNAAFADIKTRESNVTLTNDLRTAFAPATYDFAMIHLNYHDFYWESAQYHVPRTDPNAVLGGLFRAMKPGGIVAIVDHVGPAGDTRAIVEKLHRIDPATVKADFARAGFVLDGESNLLHSTTDDHTKLVFDPAVRGMTDRMVLRFRKPA